MGKDQNYNLPLPRGADIGTLESCAYNPRKRVLAAGTAGGKVVMWRHTRSALSGVKLEGVVAATSGAKTGEVAAAAAAAAAAAGSGSAPGDDEEEEGPGDWESLPIMSVSTGGNGSGGDPVRHLAWGKGEHSLAVSLRPVRDSRGRDQSDYDDDDGYGPVGNVSILNETVLHRKLTTVGVNSGAGRDDGRGGGSGGGRRGDARFHIAVIQLGARKLSVERVLEDGRRSVVDTGVRVKVRLICIRSLPFLFFSFLFFSFLFFSDQSHACTHTHVHMCVNELTR